MKVGKSNGKRNPDDERGWALYHALNIIDASAQLQAALGRALRAQRRLRETLEREKFSHNVRMAAVVATGELEALGGSAANLANETVRLQDVLAPAYYEEWRDVLRAATGSGGEP